MYIKIIFLNEKEIESISLNLIVGRFPEWTGLPTRLLLSVDVISSYCNNAE